MEEQTHFPCKNHVLIAYSFAYGTYQLIKIYLPLEYENHFLKHGFCACPPMCNTNRIKEEEEEARQLIIMPQSCCSVQILCKPEFFDPFLKEKYFTLLFQRIHRKE